MAAKFSDLVTYFQNIAEQHVDIQHSVSAKHFFRFELDEVLTGMCGKMAYPALILEAYDFSYRESNSDNIRKVRSGAFILLMKVKDMKDFNAIHEAWDECEEIGEDILLKIKADKESRLYPVLRYFNISECNGSPLAGGELGQFGMRFSFSMENAVNGEVNADKWL